LYSDRIQTIVRSRNKEIFDTIAETALEEESAIVSTHERYKGESGTPNKCGNCGKLGHPTHACYRKTNVRVNQARVERSGKDFETICYNCKMKGHYARNYPKTRRKYDKNPGQENSGNGNRLSESSRPTISSAK
jgi:hypothetical protein